MKSNEQIIKELQFLLRKYLGSFHTVGFNDSQIDTIIIKIKTRIYQYLKNYIELNQVKCTSFMIIEKRTPGNFNLELQVTFFSEIKSFYPTVTIV